MEPKPAVLHFIHPAADGKIVSRPRSVQQQGITQSISTGGVYAIACDPKASDLGPHRLATGEAWVANCKKCLKTDAWKAALKHQTPDKFAELFPDEVEAENEE